MAKRKKWKRYKLTAGRMSENTDPAPVPVEEGSPAVDAVMEKPRLYMLPPLTEAECVAVATILSSPQTMVPAMMVNALHAFKVKFNKKAQLPEVVEKKKKK
jgi:hypothetical protein